MFGFGLPTSYFSPGNYDMTNGSAWSSMNLHANQNWADLFARQSLYQVPMYNFGGFSQYPSTFGNNSYLCDPMWTVGQMATTGFFNNTGNLGFQFPWAQGSQSSSSSSTADKEEEAKMKEEIKALKYLLETYKSTNTNISSNLKTKIETALKKGGKNEEKLEALQEAYNAIPKSGLRKTMAMIDKKEYSFNDDLVAAGYKFGVSEYSYKDQALERNIKTTVSDLRSEINNISKADAAPIKFVELVGNNDILRLISYWNDEHNSDAERNIVNYVIKNLPSGTEEKKVAFDNYVVPLVDELVNKAIEVGGESCFDDDTVEALDKLKDATVKSKEKGINGLSELKTNFQKLYVMLRQMEALRINQEMQNKYEFLNDISDSDTDFINEELIVKDTKEDLEAEGLKSVSESLKSKIAVVDSEDAEDSVDNDSDNEIRTPAVAAEEVADLVDAGVLVERTHNGTKIYVETEKTGGRDYKRAFIIEGSDIKELGNVKYNGTKLEYLDPANTTIAKKTVDNDTIKDEYDDAIIKKEEENEIKKQGAQTTNDGRVVWDLLNGWTSKSDSRIIADRLSYIDSSNILYFLDGVYSEAGIHHEGLIEKLDDDTTLSTETIKGIVNSLLSKAEDMGMETNQNYLDLKELMYQHEIGHPDAENFNQYHHGWGAWILGFHTNYKEEIDKVMEKLYKDMKAKAAQA